MTIIKGMRLSLEKMIKLDRLLDFPSQAFQSIHVAGTNGKGSVSTKIAASLCQGKQIGLFTSPHVSTFRERIKVNGQMISEEEASRLWKHLEAKNVQATFFEWMTLLGFLFFAEKKVDAAVIEVGMGGAFDATNIISPMLSIITTIERDHTQFLGDTLEKIAEEKAGIIKEKVPVLVGPKAAKFPIFKQIAHKKNAPYYVVDGIYENYEMENRAIASRALELLNVPYDSRGLEALPPCRFERVNGVILDVAHNPGGFLELFSRIKEKKIHLLLGLGADKEVEDVLRIVSQHAFHVHVTQSLNPRAAKCTDLASVFEKLGYKNYTVEEDLEKAFAKAQIFSDKENALLCVCGTFYIMSAVRKLLGIVEPCDETLMSPY